MADAWIEGFPDKPGDYWFFVVDVGRSQNARVVQGYAKEDSAGNMMYVADDFLSQASFDRGGRRLWYQPLALPEPPEFDRTCPECKDESSKWYRCGTCPGTGEI